MCDKDTSSVSYDSEVSHTLERINSMNHGLPRSCDECGYKVRKKKKLRKHKAEEYNKPVSLCEQCKYKAKKTEYRNKHMEHEHKDPKYYCEQCEFETSSTEDLKHHNKTQYKAGSWEQYPPVEGSIPQFAGVYPGQSVCSVVSADSALTSPQPVSPKDQVYPCDQCGQEANQTGNLKRHKAEGRKCLAYTWGQCAHGASSTNKVKKHLDHKHKDPGYSCHQCKPKTSKTEDIKLHIGADSDSDQWSDVGGQLDGCDTISVSHKSDSGDGCDSDTCGVSQELDSCDNDTNSVTSDSVWSHTSGMLNIQEQSILEETINEESREDVENEDD